MALPIDNYGVEFHDYSYEAETLHLDEPAPMVRIAMIPRATTFRSPCSRVRLVCVSCSSSNSNLSSSSPSSSECWFRTSPSA